MHEMSLCESILRIIARRATEDGFASVRTVRIEIGALAGASEDALAFCFPLAARGTVAEGAALEFVRSGGTALRVTELDVTG